MVLYDQVIINSDIHLGKLTFFIQGGTMKRFLLIITILMLILMNIRMFGVIDGLDMIYTFSAAEISSMIDSQSADIQQLLAVKDIQKLLATSTYHMDLVSTPQINHIAALHNKKPMTQEAVQKTLIDIQQALIAIQETLPADSSKKNQNASKGDELAELDKMIQLSEFVSDENEAEDDLDHMITSLDEDLYNDFSMIDEDSFHIAQAVDDEHEYMIEDEIIALADEDQENAAESDDLAYIMDKQPKRQKKKDKLLALADAVGNKHTNFDIDSPYAVADSQIGQSTESQKDNIEDVFAPVKKVSKQVEKVSKRVKTIVLSEQGQSHDWFNDLDVKEPLQKNTKNSKLALVEQSANIKVQDSTIKIDRRTESLSASTDMLAAQVNDLAMPADLEGLLTQFTARPDFGEFGLQQILDLLDIEGIILDHLLAHNSGQLLEETIRSRDGLLRHSTPSVVRVYNRVLELIGQDELEENMYAGYIHERRKLANTLSRRDRRLFLMRMRQKLSEYYMMIRNKQYQITLA